MRDADVPAYVEHGAADPGIAGRDVLEEHDRDLYEPLDLGIGRCRLAVAEPRTGRSTTNGAASTSLLHQVPRSRAATCRRGDGRRVIKLYGSVELAPLTGLRSDRRPGLVGRDATPAPAARGRDHPRGHRADLRRARGRQALRRSHRRSVARLRAVSARCAETSGSRPFAAEQTDEQRQGRERV